MYFRNKKISKKIAFCLGDGCGLGNFLQVLPVVQALHEMQHTNDIFLSGITYPDSVEIAKGQTYVRDIYENTYESREVMYDACIISFLSDRRVNNAKKYLKLKNEWQNRSEYEEYCRVARKLGAKEFKPPQLNLSGRNFNLEPFSILIHAGCNKRTFWERKRWPHYRELAKLLLKDGFHVYCCGTTDERVDHPEVTAYMDLPIQETAALIQQSDLFVSNDSGLMHLAAALRKRQIAIFTASSDRKSGPYYNPHARVIKPELACYPCYGNDRAWNQCANWKCRDSITFDKVHDLIKTMLHQHPKDAAAATVR